LGYNTLSTLYYIKRNNLDIKVNIYSPEFNLQLIKSLINFNYPNELKIFKVIIKELSKNLEYNYNNISIEIFNGDAREYIKKLQNIDIVYQDAFSSDTNRFLWTKEYFSDINHILSNNAIITTYSVATPIRLSMYENNLHIYEYKNNKRQFSTQN
jgi:tRNA U34 5-methylaminomethyl-2-thiouridine-forming methyltransferase MnmC